MYYTLNVESVHELLSLSGLKGSDSLNLSTVSKKTTKVDATGSST